MNYLYVTCICLRAERTKNLEMNEQLIMFTISDPSVGLEQYTHTIWCDGLYNLIGLF
jgi:hypothetical protein